MKATNLISVCGSITKKESLLPVTYNILKNSCVVEANMPYSGYYGLTPGQATPNSLFLFTEHHYSLEEVLRFSQNIESCYLKNVKIASASVGFGGSTLCAIRVKYFSEYTHIHLILICLVFSDHILRHINTYDHIFRIHFLIFYRIHYYPSYLLILKDSL